MPDLDARFAGEEMMDASDVSAASLEAALGELPRINRWLGGYRATLRTLDEFRRVRRPRRLRILDVGTGAGDYPVRMIRWGEAHGVEVHVAALDLSANTIDFARRRTERLLPPGLRNRIRFIEGDARDLARLSGLFDISTSAMFFHHLSDESCAVVLREMAAVASEGVIVNDIHRHALAYWGIAAATRLLPFSTMVRHDAPVSVRRAFTRRDLDRVAERAGIHDGRVVWRWAFRWIFTNLPY